MLQKGHYATLGVARNASLADIRKAYRRLARRYHPDLHPNDPRSEEALKQVNAAYAVLSDAESRRRYDLVGADWKEVFEEDEELRRAAGFATRSSNETKSASATHSSAWAWATRNRDGLGTDLNIVKALKVVVTGALLLIAVLLKTSILPAPGPVESPVEREQRRLHAQLRNLREPMNDLNAALFEFQSGLLEQGPEVWERVCRGNGREPVEFIERTLRPNYERRYREAARVLIGEINGAELAGVFKLPPANQNPTVWRDLVSLRQDLRDLLSGPEILSCRSEVHLEGLRWQEKVTRAATEQLSLCIGEANRPPEPNKSAASAP